MYGTPPSIPGLVQTNITNSAEEKCMPRKFGNEIRLPGTTGIDNLPIPLTMTLS